MAMLLETMLQKSFEVYASSQGVKFLPGGSSLSKVYVRLKPQSMRRTASGLISLEAVEV